MMWDTEPFADYPRTSLSRDCGRRTRGEGGADELTSKLERLIVLSQLDLIDVVTQSDASGGLMTFIFGRDGVEEQRVTARVQDVEGLKEALDWL